MNIRNISLGGLVALTLTLSGCDRRSKEEKQKEQQSREEIKGFPEAKFEGGLSWANAQIAVYQVRNYPEKGESTFLIDAMMDNSLDRVIIGKHNESLGGIMYPWFSFGYEDGAERIDDTDPRLQDFVPLFNSLIGQNKTFPKY